MKEEKLKKSVAKFPQEPGVYFFMGRNGKILYVGKATSLRERVRSYFAKNLADVRSPLISEMVAAAEKIEFIKTESALEALILEANWIRKAKPAFNTMQKDDKSYNYVIITKEDFPAITTVRGHDLDMAEAAGGLPFKVKRMFGPYPYGGQLREALKIIRRIFPYRDLKCRPGQGRPCFNQQIGLCPGTCTGGISKSEYAKTIRNITLLLSGKKGTLLKTLEKEMKYAAKAREFEEAARLRGEIFALTHIRDVALIKDEPKASGVGVRFEAYDIAHISGTSVVGVMVAVENGEAKKSDYRKFRIRVNPGVNDTGALREVLERRLNHPEWPMPNFILVDGGAAQVNAAEKVLAGRGLSVPVIGVTKNERHRPESFIGDAGAVERHKKEILLGNSEAHRFAIGYHRSIRGKIR